MNERAMMWRGEDVSALGKLGGAICALASQAEAAEFWTAYVGYLSHPDAQLGGQSPEAVARDNIGYLMGYYDHETRQRAYDLFGAFAVAHPVLGRAI